MTFIQMIELKNENYIKSLPGQIEKVGDKWIVGYLRCSGCRKWIAIGAKDIKDDGVTNIAMHCSVCKLTKYYKLNGWDE